MKTVRKRSAKELDEDYMPEESESDSCPDLSKIPTTKEQRSSLRRNPDRVSRQPKKKTKRIKISIPAGSIKVNNLSDLIKLGEMYNPNYEYNCALDLETLHNLLEPLKNLNNMIGMTSFKNSIINQLIFQLTGLRDNDRNTGEPQMLHTVILAAAGMGKCFAKDTRIRMADGSIKLVQNINKGDSVMGPDSQPRKVLELGYGEEEMYEINQYNLGDNYIVNKSHILALQQQFAPQLIYQSDQNRYIVQWYDYQGYFENIFEYQAKNEISARVAEKKASQFLQNCPKRGTKIDITVEEYLHRSDKWKEAYGGYHAAVHYRQPSYCQIHMNSIYKNLIKGSIRHIPQNIKQADYSVRFNLAKTIAEGQQSLTISEDKFQLAIDLKDIIDSTGKWYAKLAQPDDTSYVLTLYERKDIPHPIHVKLLSVSNYYGFQLNGDDRHFLLADGTVVHNTTVAKIIGEIYAKMGILSKGHFITANRANLIGEVLGNTAIKTQKLLESARGGVLFIDEVYSLGPFRNDEDSYSKECIDMITQFLSENAADFICIVAGYKEEVEQCFFARNPGLTRRFPYRFIIDPYTAPEMHAIFRKFVGDSDWSFMEESGVTDQFFENNMDYFPFYGGDLKVFFDNCKIAHARRTFILPPDNWKKLTATDIEEGFKLYKKIKGL